jgi:hypothetical protein
MSATAVPAKQKPLAVKDGKGASHQRGKNKAVTE